jgi:hypothetical protein
VFYIASTGQDTAGQQRANALWNSMAAYRTLIASAHRDMGHSVTGGGHVAVHFDPAAADAICLPVSEAMWIGFFTLMTAWSWRYGRPAVARLR